MKNFFNVFKSHQSSQGVDSAMTSIVDSKAHFLKRCREVGLSDRAVNALTANGFERGPARSTVSFRGLQETAWVRWRQLQRYLR